MIQQTAVDDELLVKEPCRVAGGGEARTIARPTFSMRERRIAFVRLGRHIRFDHADRYAFFTAGRVSPVRRHGRRSTADLVKA